MEQDTAERIAGLEMQVKIFKWALGGFCVLMLTVSGSLTKWIYAQGIDAGVLRNKVITQQQVIKKHEKKIDKAVSSVGRMGRDIQANTIHLKHIKEMTAEIKEILKKQRR